MFLSDLEQLLLMSYYQYIEALHNKILCNTLPKLSISVTIVNVAPIKFLKILPHITDNCFRVHRTSSFVSKQLCVETENAFSLS